MIDAINEMFQVWGAQRRAMDFGADQGWLERCVVAKFRDSQYERKQDNWFRVHQRTAKGADDFAPRPIQFTEEGHRGEGLAIAVAMRKEPAAPEALQAIAYLKYVIFCPVWYEGSADKYKSQRVGLSTTEYWRYIDRLHYWTAARLDAVGTPQVGEPQQKMFPGGLQNGGDSTTKPITTVTVPKVSPPEIDFEALRRSKVSLKA